MSKETTSHDAIAIVNQKKREVAIFISITLVVLIVLIVFPIRLMALKVIQINNEIEGKRGIKEQLDEKIDNFTQLNAQYQEIREDMEDLPLIYPNTGDYSLLVSNIDEIAKANHFRLTSVRVESERIRGDENPFETLNIWTTSINVTGRRTDLVGLLEDVEALPMFPTVKSVSYSNELDDDGLLTFRITMRVYGVDESGIYVDI